MLNKLIILKETDAKAETVPITIRATSSPETQVELKGKTPERGITAHFPILDCQLLLVSDYLFV